MLTRTCPAGTFSGFEKDGCTHFTGIRYAVSERFEKPVPYVYGEGVHDCTQPAPYAVQLPSKIEYALYHTRYEDFPQVESCQYLSITVPAGATPAAPLPVMVWIHGGANRNGGCDSPSYDRTLLAREGNVIVVGINYRLGVLGFVRDSAGHPANLGILDIIEALKWLQTNISSFGGDASALTLFGQSSGADCIRCIMLAKGTEHLYKRAILESDPIGTMEGREEMESKILTEVNEAADSLGSAGSLDSTDSSDSIKKIQELQANVFSHVTEKGLAKYLILGPHFGVDPLPPKNELEGRLKEIAKDHEILLGNNEREVGAYIGTNSRVVKLWKFKPTRWILEKVIANLSHKIFIDPTTDFAESYARAGGKTYRYMFSWMKGKHVLGATHDAEYLTLFGIGKAEGAPGSMGLTAEEVYEAGIPMRKIWTDFARNGAINLTDINSYLTVKEV